MKCVCNTCGKLFDEKEIYIDPATVALDVGYKGEEQCPFCFSQDIEDAIECEFCGEWHKYEDMCGGMCKDCIQKEVTQDKVIAADYVEDFTTVKVPRYFAWLLGDSGVRVALEQAVRADGTDEDAREYVADDSEAFLKYFKYGKGAKE